MKLDNRMRREIPRDPLPGGRTYNDVLAKGSYAEAGLTHKPSYAELEEIIGWQSDELDKLRGELKASRSNEERLQVTLAKSLV